MTELFEVDACDYLYKLLSTFEGEDAPVKPLFTKFVVKFDEHVSVLGQKSIDSFRPKCCIAEVLRAHLILVVL